MKQKPNRIFDIRRAKGITQEKMAELVGCGTSQIVKLEHGERRLTDAWKDRIAAVLDVDPDYLTFEGPLPTGLHEHAQPGMAAKSPDDVQLIAEMTMALMDLYREKGQDVDRAVCIQQVQDLFAQIAAQCATPHERRGAFKFALNDMKKNL